MSLAKAFNSFANRVSTITGRPLTFVLCISFVVVWALTGPMFKFSDTWQLIINTSTTIITFLMVFLIQNTQNRDNLAVHAKLDALIECSQAPNRFIGIEDLTDEELEKIVAEQNEHAPVDSPKPGKKAHPPQRAPARTTRKPTAPKGG